MKAIALRLEAIDIGMEAILLFCFEAHSPTLE